MQSVNLRTVICIASGANSTNLFVPLPREDGNFLCKYAKSGQIQDSVGQKQSRFIHAPILKSDHHRLIRQIFLIASDKF